MRWIGEDAPSSSYADESWATENLGDVMSVLIALVYICELRRSIDLARSSLECIVLALYRALCQ